MPFVSANSRPRVALIGISGYGSIYLGLARDARDQGLIDLTAAVVINPEEEQTNEQELREHGCRIFRDYGSMLRELRGQIDLCLIPTGIQWHARMTVAALEAGAQVLVEKPLAGSLAEAKAIRAAENRTGRWVAVGFQDLYCPVNLWLKEQILQGVIGELQQVRFVGLWPRATSYFSRNGWAGRLHADGVLVRDSLLNNAFAHFVTLGLFFAGSEMWRGAEVQIESAELLRSHAIETFDTSVVRGRTERGIEFWVGASHVSERTLEPIISITGTRGEIEWRHGESCTIRPHGGRVEERVLPDIDDTRRSMFTAVLSRLREAGANICDTRLALAHTAFIEAVHARAQPTPLPPSPRTGAGQGNEEGRYLIVPGLTEALLRAFAAGSTLVETGYLITPVPSPQR